MRKFTLEEFIAQSRSKNGDKYSYDKSVYVEAHTKLIVTCPDHGDFLITPNQHRRGVGCYACGLLKRAKSRKSTLDKFTRKSVEVHGPKYDYSKVLYEEAKTPVEIVCKQHGSFFQTPNNHMRGQGCPSCQKNGYRPNLPGKFYVLKSNNLVKIGITNRKAALRLSSINRSSGLTFEVVRELSFEDGRIALDIENTLLKELRTTYKQPTTIFDGSTECFYDVDLDNLKERIDALIISLTTK